MKQYVIPTCFWCGKGLETKPCVMSQELGEPHEKQRFFSSDLPKERLPRGAREIKLDEIGQISNDYLKKVPK